MKKANISFPSVEFSFLTQALTSGFGHRPFVTCRKG